MFTVLGATGTVGGQLAASLLGDGHRVRAVGRSASRLDTLARLGAEPAVADATDVPALTDAMRGSSAVFVMQPADATAVDHMASQRSMTDAIVGALRDSGVSRVVVLSSVGAEIPSGTGFLAGLHVMEQGLASLPDVDMLTLRAGWFYDNARAYLPLIQHAGLVADSLDPDVAVPMVATRDIAAAAREALTGESWGGGHPIREILGPVDLDQATVTRVLGRALGLPEMEYVRLSDDDMIATLVAEAGFSPDVARHHVGMTRAINDGRVAARHTGVPVITGPTTIDDYAATLAEALLSPDKR
ncbi:NAD(P)H-binding protein [Gordonia sp. 'Campus']|uniref:NAD(P)H-binding protein n=1 Tax=Gordonia sp. 'Campus' TaxID=2915824 RepID=UPI001EE3CF0A|nr:NAD(P)H-binding protein [Gordonia sp. 'Campus']